MADINVNTVADGSTADEAQCELLLGPHGGVVMLTLLLGAALIVVIAQYGLA